MMIRELQRDELNMTYNRSQNLSESDTEKYVVLKNIKGDLYGVNPIPNELYNFYLLKRQQYRDGSNRWDICMELASNSRKCWTLGSVKGFREDAERSLEKILARTGKRLKIKQQKLYIL